MIRFVKLILILLPLHLVVGQENNNATKTSRALSVLHAKKDHGNILQFVDPFIGTGGHGHTFPGASAPFGMMQLSPDTRHDGWDGCSGYHYSDDVIYGFSHTHLSGTGVPDYCDLLIVPQMGKAKITPGYKDLDGYGAKFQHKNETASPGYYSVMFDNGIKVQLTTNDRSGMHVYRFPDKTSEKHILIDLDHRDEVLLAEFDIINNHTIEGIRHSKSWAEKQQFYFSLEASIDFIKTDLITTNGAHKLLLTFPSETEELKLKVGISSVEKSGARLNLATEIKTWDFNALKSIVENKWLFELSKIQIKTKQNDDLRKFYTALYHSFLSPNIFNDVDGRYLGRDGAIHQLPKGENQYTVFSLWDTYRAAHPLFTITQPERTVDFIKTFERQYIEGGDLPVWELAGNETECMIGYHSVSVIADAYIKEMIDFNIEVLIQAVIATSNFNEFGKKSFNEKGFISVSNEPESVSKNLEYAYDSYCIYLFLKKAKSKGYIIDDELVTTYLNRSFNFINTYDPTSGGFMRGRRDGLWFSPFQPEEVNFNYTEANSWQYSLYAPQSINVLSELLENGVGLNEYLNKLFTTKSQLLGREQVDITGLIGQYAHGNEPSHHMAYLYNFTNEPFKTALIVDSILAHYYTTAPDGLSGNEDCGQMSAWYVLSSLGFYPVCPGVPNYALGRPIFDLASINVNGNVLNITYLNNNSNNKFISGIKVNSENYSSNYITHEMLVRGGNWEIEMSDSPEVLNGLEKDISGEKLPIEFTPIPYFEQTNQVFEKSMKLSLAQPLNKRDFSIFYTTNGSDPTEKNTKRFTKPFSIKNTSTVKAVVFNNHTKKYGTVVSNKFILKDNSVSLELSSKYENQYAANGPTTLIDGITGTEEYRTGDWQGYWNTPIEGKIKFTSFKTLKNIELRFLQDTRSWIFPPSSVQVKIQLEDGTEKVKTAFLKETEQNSLEKKAIKSYIIPVDGERVKSFQFYVKNFGKCPEWHLGNGNDTWLFIDEILFN